MGRRNDGVAPKQGPGGSPDAIRRRLRRDRDWAGRFNRRPRPPTERRPALGRCDDDRRYVGQVTGNRRQVSGKLPNGQPLTPDT